MVTPSWAWTTSLCWIFSGTAWGGVGCGCMCVGAPRDPRFLVWVVASLRAQLPQNWDKSGAQIHPCAARPAWASGCTLSSRSKPVCKSELEFWTLSPAENLGCF